ncbi:MAG: hypothetical protein RSE56_02045 [Bacilli bacterium]
MNLYLFLTLVAIGWVTCVMTLTKYVQILRGESTLKLNDVEVALCSFIFASPLALVWYLFSEEIRLEDMAHHRRFLLITLGLLAVHIVVVFCLFYFNVIIVKL